MLIVFLVFISVKRFEEKGILFYSTLTRLIAFMQKKEKNCEKNVNHREYYNMKTKIT